MIANEADTTMDNLKFLPTCNDSLIIGVPLICAGGAATGFWGWRLWPVSRSPAGTLPRGRFLRPTPRVAHPWWGLPLRGLLAAVGSQFLIACLNESTARSGSAGVRAFEPGASRAIQNGGEHARRVSWHRLEI